MPEAHESTGGAGRLVTSWSTPRLARRAPAPGAPPVPIERLAARLIAAAREAGRPGVAWLDPGGPSLPDDSASVLAAFPVRRLRLGRDETDQIPRLLAAIDGRDRDGAANPRRGFAGGWIGFLGYEAASGLEPVALSAPRDAAVPLASWGRYPTWFRHVPAAARLELWTRRVPNDDAGGQPGLAHWAAWATAAVEERPGPLEHALAAQRHPQRAIGDELVARGERSFTRSGFEAAVGHVQAAVREGEIFQANVAHRIRVPAHADPFAVHIALRRLNPSPFALFLEEEWGALASNSPERLFEVRPEDGGHTVEARPIAGTRPRGATAATDAALAAELRTSTKERAEHTMLVDLARNDIGRIARPGSVRVRAFQTVEAYSHVHHLVSRVTGRLRAGIDLVHLAAALFPGGTITGAPKLRSMEVIDRVEPVARGPYTGSAGYINPDGSMDWNILIRTLVFAQGRADAYAGAGIVADSDPAREYEETLHKAAAMLAALAAAEQRLAPLGAGGATGAAAAPGAR